MAKLTKRQKAIAEKVEHGKVYTFDEAVTVLKDVSSVKFSESVEILTNRFAVQQLYLTVQVKLYALQFSPRAKMPRKLKQLVLTL